VAALRLGVVATMCRPAVVTIEGQRRTWKISPSSTRATSPEEATSSAPSSSAFMHDLHAGQDSESEDEGEEMRGLVSRKPRCDKRRVSRETEGGDSPMPEAESTAAWERLMAPAPLSLGVSVSALPWDRPSDSRDEDDDDDDNAVRLGLAGGLNISAAKQQQKHKHKQQYRDQAEPLASPEQA